MNLPQGGEPNILVDLNEAGSKIIDFPWKMDFKKES
jgi:hypothetical protein